MKKLLVLAGLAGLAGAVLSALRGRVVDHGVDHGVDVATPVPPSAPPSAPSSDEEYEDAVLDTDDGDDTNDEPDLGAIDEPAAALAEQAAEVPMPIEKADPAPPRT